MRGLLAVAVISGLCLAMLLRPAWVAWVAERVPRLMRADDGSSSAATEDGADHIGLLPQPYVRRRLDALVEELERLDSDPDVFARAFHTMVARSAREALLADESRLARQPRSPASSAFDVELPRSTGWREELEL